MRAILPPRQIPKERRIMRRVKAYRCSKWFMTCCMFALTALIARAQLVAFAALGVGGVAGIGALVYRLVEAPQEITVRDYSHARKEPPVVHLNRKG